MGESLDRIALETFGDTYDRINKSQRQIVRDLLSIENEAKKPKFWRKQ